MTTDEATRDLQVLAREAIERQQLHNQRQSNQQGDGEQHTSAHQVPKGNFGLHGITEDKLEALISASSYL